MVVAGRRMVVRPLSLIPWSLVDGRVTNRISCSLFSAASFNTVIFASEISCAFRWCTVTVLHRWVLRESLEEVSGFPNTIHHPQVDRSRYKQVWKSNTKSIASQKWFWCHHRQPCRRESSVACWPGKWAPPGQGCGAILDRGLIFTEFRAIVLPLADSLSTSNTRPNTMIITIPQWSINSSIFNPTRYIFRWRFLETEKLFFHKNKNKKCSQAEKLESAIFPKSIE